MEDLGRPQVMHQCLVRLKLLGLYAGVRMRYSRIAIAGVVGTSTSNAET